jgi:ferritin-like metal-binding protein YciE
VRYATLETVLDAQLREILAGELHIARQLSRIMEGVSSSELKNQISKAVREYQSRAERLGRLFDEKKLPQQGAHSRIVEAFMRQCWELVEHRGDDLLLDHGLVSILRHVECYERSLCESAREVANALDDSDVIAVLELDLEEHGRMERYLTVLEEDMLDAVAARRLSTEVSGRYGGAVAR